MPPVADTAPQLVAAPAPQLVLGAPDVRALARRSAVPAAVLGVAAVAIVLARAPLQAFADALARALDADPRWVAAAALFELLSFAGYIALLWLVGGRATPRLGLRASAEVTLGGAAATRLLPAGGAGGAALTFWAFRRAGLGAHEATRTLLAFLVLLYSVFLASIVAAGAALSLGPAPGSAPLVLSAVPAAGATLAIVVALALAARPPHRTVGLRGAPATLGAAVRDAIALLRGGDVRLLGAPAWWAFDAAVLWAMLHALGAPPALAVVALAYFVGQVANTIPVPGAVSGGMVGALLAFGVEVDLALASVLAYRAVAIWLPAPIGLAALGALRRTVARWAHQDGCAGEAPPAAAAAKRDREPRPPAAAATGAREPRPAAIRPCREPAVQVAA
jgi:uncharacterized membrane protein YbhN (UPF0104 family)